ncbi:MULTISPECIES: SH3-like domain-containing protein [Legionella]|uniref:Thiocyanate hydrolase subunit alpha n=1 Tax=Legionella steigerwaltii TaxID=460 RepID=A0A378L9A9_9GAMM|nr:MULTISPECIES: SH3-like domain-containing protein [Legionella]KTD77019.1 thiocyanate hydrolase subunit alpha [Legionella steigerwaltii]MBN9228278.1 nitrile hydratase subunit beta [Legionella steelei]OJW09528.1 MAG: ScnA [Legionella sp. 39-23]STY22448.1 thiocyanate hydrolase subunit alpha [Legionella steigerwaltii]
MSTKFKVGDKVRVIDLPSLFHTRTQGYTRGKIGEVVLIRPSWVIPEDEAWGRYEGRREPFYMVRFKMTDLWDDYGGPAIDTLDTELSERWIEHI